MKKILIVDDEKDILEFLEYNLKKEGYAVITASNGSTALDRITENPDLVVLDIMMPGMDGFEVCRQIRAQVDYVKVPIIFLTAKAGEFDEIRGLDLGANDYINKPISPGKFLARVRANLRSNESSREDKKIIAGALQIDREKYEISIDGIVKYFPKKEFEILTYLASNSGKVFDRDAIQGNIWDSNVLAGARTVDVHIRKIREKLGDYAEMIETIKGVGYRFKKQDKNK